MAQLTEEHGPIVCGMATTSGSNDDSGSETCSGGGSSTGTVPTEISADSPTAHDPQAASRFGWCLVQGQGAGRGMFWFGLA